MIEPRIMICAAYEVRIGHTRKNQRISIGKPKGRHYWRVLSLDGRPILRKILRKKVTRI
jgi:hypothetical protein